MNKEIKYTTDGKKVVVLGSLNSNEKIVQEIFIVDGSEIPSGEHFVVKSLHDAPAVSWKEDRLKKIDELYDKTYDKKSAQIDKMEKDIRFKTELVQKKLFFLREIENSSFIESECQRLIDFISGNIKYLVFEKYGELGINDFDVELVSKDRYGRFDSLKLLSILGDTDGNLQYRINQYSDGSGGSTKIYPCKTMDEALDILKNRFNDLILSGLTDSLLKTANQYNIQIPDDKIKEYNAKKRAELLKSIEREKQLLDKLNQDLLRYEFPNISKEK